MSRNVFVGNFETRRFAGFYK